jgi:hypothetical protein
MMRLIVNNRDKTLDSGAKTWGELLAHVDADLHAEGRVVTAARLDGVDEPSFRDPSLSARTLTDVAVIEIDADSPAALLTEAIREASTGLDRLCGHAIEVSRRFRGRELDHAQQGLLSLVQGLQVLTSLAATIGTVLQTDLRALLWNGRPVSELLDALGGHLEALIEAQSREDWLTVADVVEFDLEPALRACRPLFEALATAATPQH